MNDGISDWILNRWELSLSAYSFMLIDHKDAMAMERLYFANQNGHILSQINGTHGVVTAVRS